MPTSNLAQSGFTDGAKPIPLTFDEIEAVSGGTPPAAALVAAFAAGCVVGTAAVATGAALGVAANAAYNAATDSSESDKKPIIAPGT